MEAGYSMEHRQPPRKPNVIHLSNNTLTDTQINILEKGLKFTTTPKASNYTEIKEDISQFCRRLRLYIFFNITLKMNRLLETKAITHQTKENIDH